MQFLAPIIRSNVGDYNTAEFYAFLTPIGVITSIILSILAIIGIWEKDNAKYFGIGGDKQEKTKISEYVEIFKNNKPMQRLMVAGAGCKLALSIATNTTVLCMLYGCMMGNYDGLYLPMMKMVLQSIYIRFYLSFSLVLAMVRIIQQQICRFNGCRLFRL